MYDESVSEPEDVRMARLHSLLTKTKTPLLPIQNKNPRRTPTAASQTEDPYGKQPFGKRLTFNTPPRGSPFLEDTTSPFNPPPKQSQESPSRPLRTIKPPSHLPPSEWRTTALLNYHTNSSPPPPPPNPRTPSTFPFLSLPSELRLAIYFELLVSSDRLLPTWRGPQKATRQQKKIHPGILQTCRLCLVEGAKVLYGENVFDFGEICNRPDNFSARFVERIGRRNAARIRIVVGEYGAAAEELGWKEGGEKGGEGEEGVVVREMKGLLTVEYLRCFLGKCGIELSELRVLALSLVPYGCDQATGELLRREDKAVRSNSLNRMKWMEAKNEAGKLARMVEGICEREKGFMKAGYWEDIDGWIGVSFSPPSSGREWIVYRGVRGREEELVEDKKTKEIEKVEEYGKMVEVQAEEDGKTEAIEKSAEEQTDENAEGNQVMSPQAGS